MKSSTRHASQADKLGENEIEWSVEWGKLRGYLSRVDAPVRGIAFHGWLDNSASMRPLIEEVATDEAWIVADLAGHGRSDHRPVGTSYHLVEWLVDFRRTVDTLKLNKVDLIGHSLGGAVALMAAACFPERVRSVVTIEALGPIPRPARWLEHVRRHADGVTSLPLKRSPKYKTVEEAIRARVAASDLSFEHAAKIIEAGLVLENNAYRWRTDPRLRLPVAQPLSEPDVLESLREVRCPVLLVKANPGIFPPEYPAEDRKNAIARLEEIELPGGHHVHLERPLEVATAVRDFLERLESA